MRLATVVAIFCLAGHIALPLWAEDPTWNLVWQDDFNRDEVGQDWYVCRGKASIRDGRLLLEGAGATIVTERRFAADVRIEFDAEAQPGVPPCDLSATIAASKEFGYGYLYAFGGANNRVNQLLGPGVHLVDQKPGLLIEPGRVYHIVAQKEGKRFTCTVDGTTILDASAEDPAGGPGFDRVGLVTWAGMLADNFKVYERTLPHPDTPDYPTALPRGPLHREGRVLLADPDVETPGLDKALQAFNSRDYRTALARFRAVQDPVISLLGECWVLGDLGYEEKPQYRIGGVNEEFADLARRLAQAATRCLSQGFDLSSRGADRALVEYARVARWLPELITVRSGMTAARRLVGLGEENNPFYHKARLYMARYHYWNGAEAGDVAVKEQALSWMADLKKLWPEHTILRQYTGEKIPWGNELIADTQDHPAWAAYLREAYARQIKIMERFFAERQAPDGQLGGGYGDDVELMRTWMQIASISSSSRIVRAGIERLAEGVWQNELVNGYAGLGDVEHSAEPSADTLPGMLLLNYGDPLWVERNLQSCKTIHDVCMGIDRNGYPRFKSAEIGWNGANTAPQAGGDTGYHARAMKHFIWQAWWGDLEAKDWFVRWCDGWRAATMSAGDGKLPGFVPFTLWYPSGDMHPPGGGAWYDSTLHYYGNMGGMVHDSFLCAWYFTHDRKFLEPFQIGMDSVTYGPLLSDGVYEPGSTEWQRSQMMCADDGQRPAVYRWLTGDRVYDEYTMRFGNPVHKYLVTHDLDAFLASFETIAKANRYNLELQTTEVLSTDRAALAGALTVFGAYTGAVTSLRDAAAPTFAVTYDTADEDFAAVVTESTDTRVRIWLYSFHKEPMRIGLRFWQLVPGRYVLNQGELLPGEYPCQHRYGWIGAQDLDILHRADSAYVTVLPGKVWVVDVRLRESIPIPDRAPDLAISARDVSREASGLRVTVHNIGNAPSKPTSLLFEVEDGGVWRKAGEVRVPAIAPPKRFTPSKVSVFVNAPLPAGDSKCRVIVDPLGRQYEICETNSTAVF
ncbi:MAG: hypothetical protein ACP5R5_01060 [Armatimonadota bacterium]